MIADDLVVVAAVAAVLVLVVVVPAAGTTCVEVEVVVVLGMEDSRGAKRIFVDVDVDVVFFFGFDDDNELRSTPSEPSDSNIAAFDRWRSAIRESDFCSRLARCCGDCNVGWAATDGPAGLRRKVLGSVSFSR